MRQLIFALFFFFLSVGLFAGELRHNRSISWKAVHFVGTSQSGYIPMARFEGANYVREYGHLPIYTEAFPLPPASAEVIAWIENPVYDIAPYGFEKIEGLDMVQPDPEITVQLSYDRKKPVAVVTLLPVRKNNYSGELEILVSFDLVVHFTEEHSASRMAVPGYADQSVLASGNWYKIKLEQTGIHRITYNDLQGMGINPANIDPRNIRIYGNGGGMLPESLAEFRHDDLVENNIFVAGEADGRFDQQDYILFYGESPHKWAYQPFSQAFWHNQNIYSDHTYYFLTVDPGPGKRIPEQPSSAQSPSVMVSKFTDYAYHERDLFNLVNTGRVWYGEVFDVTTTYDFNFNFPNLDLTSQAYLRGYVAAKSTSASAFVFSHGSQEVIRASINGIPSTSETFARPYIGSNWFTPSSSNINIRINYQKTAANSMGWLNFIELNVIRNLVFSGGQMAFRDPGAVSPGSIAEFTLGGAPQGQGVQIWNVTDPAQALRVQTIQSGNSQVFRLPHDTLQEFIAFDGSSYFQVQFVDKVANQNLHATGPKDMIIISHSLFLEQANRLANFHMQHDGLSVLVTDVEKVYNEFSSGAQDITAIRDFMKMLYDKASPGQEPRYLLLFGDASFDYKDRIKDNSNFVPTWEDNESLTIVYSIATDDYYGFLDGPGDNILDIGIGRLPVSTVEQATVAVDKNIHYATNSAAVMKEWRNYISFVADDEDGNMHLNQAEQMASFLNSNYGVYNVDKIYVDAFPQVSTPGGQRAPEVNQAINNRIDKGCLVMNYTGHGGEVGWGHERFLEIIDINSWTNYDRMPIFITATCEFSRFDDPERVSAGEHVFLNPKGGSIAMFTAARATFGGSNFNLNTALFEIMFEEHEGGYYRFGDLIRIAKNKGGVVDNDKKFVLLGNPALHLAYPEYDVITTRINGEAAGEVPDTLQALARVTIDGEIVMNGRTAGEFNGTLYSIVFDKPSQVTTLGTDPTSQLKTFELQNNILYKGKAQITNGMFSFTFIVPKDIAYQYGFGKISYYAVNENSVNDAHGYYRNIVVGGFNLAAEPDETGPLVRLFMNDDNFVSGGITNENPFMLAFVNDESGINTVGSGIGHDIVAILDGNTDKPFILNDFYEADLDSYTSGTIRFPFHNLPEGRHTLSLKVWDVFNNSGEAYIEFVVMLSGRFVIEELMNYPNPFFENTTFVFSHNQPDSELDISLRIFSMAGHVVKTFERKLVAGGYRTEPIYWDGCDEGGYPLSQGIYLYKIMVKNQTGQ
ncbi:MAG: type IX secretion system sortase PorU, partial [Bacteroidales bacterium]|nr:type IX secretion system sortase PorU [Bacteroidales bacterium]